MEWLCQMNGTILFLLSSCQLFVYIKRCFVLFSLNSASNHAPPLAIKFVSLIVNRLETSFKMQKGAANEGGKNKQDARLKTFAKMALNFNLAVIAGLYLFLFFLLSNSLFASLPVHLYPSLYTFFRVPCIYTLVSRNYILSANGPAVTLWYLA
jgi:hypothetical protein